MDILDSIAYFKSVNLRYTPIGLKLGFGPTRKLPEINDRKSPNIRNMRRLTIIDSRGFGAVHIPSFRLTRVYLLLLLALLWGCTSSRSQDPIRIGYDPTWYGIDVEGQATYLNGYMQELLLEMSRNLKVPFALIQTHSSDLLSDLNQGKCNAILSDLMAYEFNLAKYDFSLNCLDLGPVFIVPKDAKKDELDEMKGELVGVLEDSSDVVFLEQIPDILIRTFDSIPSLLDAVKSGALAGALLPQNLAAAYVCDLYAQDLKLIGQPLSAKGIRFVSPKGKMDALNRALKRLQEKGVLQKLQKKWQFQTC